MAMLGKGTTITFGPVTGLEVKPFCVSAIGDLAFTAGQVDATCYGNSNFRKYIPGLKEPGTIDLTTNYVANDASAKALYNAFISGKSQIWIMTWPSGATWKFNGVILGFTATTPIDDKIQQTFSIQVSGNPEFTEAPVPATVVVTFDGNGGTGFMQPAEVPTATPYTIPTSTFTPPEGKQFDVWIDEINTIYTPEETANLVRDTNLTAKWKAAA